MKKTVPVLLAILLLFACAAGGLYALHTQAPVRAAEAPAISVLGQLCGPAEGLVYTETLWGYGGKETELMGSPVDLGVFARKDAPLEIVHAERTASAPLTADGDYTTVEAGAASYCRVDLEKGGERLLSGASLNEYGAYTFSENGRYDLTVSLGYTGTEERDETDYVYRVSFSLRPEPFVEISQNEAFQGAIMSLILEPAFYKDEPEIETELGSAVFIPRDDGSFLSLIPVWYAQAPGEYPVSVRLGDWEHTETVTVTETKFGRQDLTMPQSTVDATRGQANANEDYAEKIKPTYEIADRARYWEGLFIRPVEGRITTQFGLYRYTNGSKTPTRHTGVDLAIAKGTPVPASNSGRVLYAGPVIISGNTVVIEHGGGLKTYYMHLDSIDVSEGDMVKKGDMIGKVGTTGYSTGPHLHFEVKIGSMSLDPWSLFDGTSGIYYFDGN